jgi:hypothetical protein
MGFVHSLTPLSSKSISEGKDHLVASTAIGKSRRAKVLTSARKLHLWVGTFFAPAILFFAFSGALQTLDFHENKRGDSSQPAAWITRIAQLHKKQNLNNRRPNPPQAKPADAAAKPVEQNRPAPKPDGAATLTFKAFTALMSVGLILSTLLGLFMTFQYVRDKRVTWVLLIAGALLPLAMILFM